MATSSSFTLVRDANCRLFWIGQGISWLGSVMQSVAQGWLLWSLTGAPEQLALAAMVLSLPVLLFSIPAGAVADRYDKRALLMFTQGGSLIPTLLLGILTASGAVTAQAVISLCFCQGMLNAFDAPARQALLAELVPRPSLSQAVALNSVLFNASRFAGPALAGCIVAAFGAAPCFFLNALSFLAATCTLLLVRTPYRQARPSRIALQRAQLHEGLRFVSSKSEFRRPLVSVLLVSLFAIPFVPLLPVFAASFDRGPGGLGLMSACLGSGALLAALHLARSEQAQEPPDAAGAGMLFALSLLLFSRSADYSLSLFALFLAGGAAVVFLAGVNRSLQQACPDLLRGRVMGVYALALLGMAPVGSALMAWATAGVGARSALTITSSLCVAGLAMLEVSSRRDMTAQSMAPATTLLNVTWSVMKCGGAGNGVIRRRL